MEGDHAEDGRTWHEFLLDDFASACLRRCNLYRIVVFILRYCST